MEKIKNGINSECSEPRPISIYVKEEPETTENPINGEVSGSPPPATCHEENAPISTTTNVTENEEKDTIKKRKLPEWTTSSENEEDYIDGNNEATTSKRTRTNNTRAEELVNTPTQQHMEMENEAEDQPSENVEIPNSTNVAEEPDRELNEAAADTNTEGETRTVKKRILPSWMTSGAVDRVDDGNNPASTTRSQDATDEESPSSSITTSSNERANQDIKIKKEPKEEQGLSADVLDPRPSCSTSSVREVKPAVKVEKADATSSTTRPTCRYGIRCYRRNPMHRIEEAHPGDDDYRRPDYPPPPDDSPDCPFGSKCYRRNPAHFQQYKHPPDTDFKQNYKRYMLRRRQKQMRYNDTNAGDYSSGNSSEHDDYDFDDPFLDDADLDADYVPTDDDADEDTEDLLADYDDCDKVEE